MKSTLPDNLVHRFVIMRYLIGFFALLLALACHKTTSSPPPATLSFMANGTSYQINGSLATSAFGSQFERTIGSGCIATDTILILKAVDNAGDTVSIGSEHVSSLVVGTYPDSLTLIRTDPNGSTCSEGASFARLANLYLRPFVLATTADHSTLTVTSLHDGLTDGTFEAHLTIWRSSPDSIVTITDGQFKNVPIVNKNY